MLPEPSVSDPTFQSLLLESAFGVHFWTPTLPALRVLHESELLLTV